MPVRGRKPHRTISIEAERDYIVALGAVAESSGQTIGSIVKQALDAYCGDDINRVKAYLAKLDTQKYQTIPEKAL